MICTKCGYSLGPFDKNCPRCAQSEIPRSTGSQQAPTPTTQSATGTSAPNTSASPSQSPSTSHFGVAPTKNANSNLLAWSVAGVLGFALIISLFRGSNQTPVPQNQSTSPLAPIEQPLQPAQPQVRIGPSFNEVDAKMDGRLTGWTEAQKQAYWASVSGTKVIWSGEVTEVQITSGGEISLKCNPKTWTSDVSVTLDGSQIDKLPSINKAQRITVEGILQDHTSFGYTISQGRIAGL